MPPAYCHNSLSVRWGFVPSAFVLKATQVQRPLAPVVIGGLITATLLTLIVLPAYMRALLLRERCKRSRTATCLCR